MGCPLDISQRKTSMARPAITTSGQRPGKNAAGIFGMPVLLYHFHALSVWSVLAAVLSLWAVPWVMLFGLLSLAAMLLYQSVGAGLFLLAARVLAGLAGLFARWILLVGKAVSRLPSAVVSSNRLWLLAVTLLIALGLALALHGFERMSRHRLRQRVGCWLAVSLLCLFSGQTVQLLGQHLVPLPDGKCAGSGAGQAGGAGGRCLLRVGGFPAGAPAAL